MHAKKEIKLACEAKIDVQISLNQKKIVTLHPLKRQKAYL